MRKVGSTWLGALASSALLAAGGGESRSTSANPSGTGVESAPPTGFCEPGNPRSELWVDPDVRGRFPAGAPGFAVHDLGVVRTEPNGLTPELTFEATSATRAFYVVAIGNAGAVVGLFEAVAPDGTHIVKPDAPESDSPPSGHALEVANYFSGLPGPVTSPNKALPHPRAAAALIPNTPAIAIEPGTYRLRVGAVDVGFDEARQRYANRCLQASVRVIVVERTIDPPEHGSIDLALRFTPESGLSAATARADASLQTALWRLESIYRGVGIALESVTYDDAPSVGGIIEMSGPACLGNADEVSSFDRVPSRPGAVELLFVRGFTCMRGSDDFGKRLAAISNGTPALPLATHDGVLVGTSNMKTSPKDWPLVIAHELGHFFGLFHTCEPVGVCDDIPDTPDSDPAANLMFPNLSASTKAALTPEQGAVMRLSPLVHPR